MMKLLSVAALLSRAVIADIMLPKYGPISGLKVEADMTLNQPIRQSVEQYLGVPYADPPERFKPPKEFTGKWEATRAFTKYAKDCMSGTKGSEDCLYINIYVPSSASVDDPIPVMFYIYGGGFTYGRVALYDGTATAAQDNEIVVTVSYRFGIHGFFASEATMKESNTTGNWGILDQRMALQWVNDNIEYFGGDTDRITIYGESAGAISVATHLVSEKSQPLFQNAIIQSGILDLDLFYLSTKDSYLFYDWVAKTIANCANNNDMECLRRIPATRFAIKQYIRDDPVKAPTWAASLFPFFSVGLTIDNTEVFGSPLDMVLAGKVPKHISVIIGITQDEGTVFALAAPVIKRPVPKLPPSEEEVVEIIDYFIQDKDLVQKRFDSEFPEYRKKYPLISTSPDDEGDRVWNADKRARYESYKATLNPNLIDVHEQVAIQQERDAANENLCETDQRNIFVANTINELFTRDLASESLENILANSPQLSQIYAFTKPNVGWPDLPQYDKAPLAFLTSTARDVIFSCPSLQMAAALRDQGNSVFFYNLALDVWDKTMFYNVDLKSAGVKSGNQIAVSDLGVFHGADIPLVFKLFKSKPTHIAEVNTFSLFNLFTGSQFSKPGDAAHKVADAIGCYWSNLAKYSDVNHDLNCHGQELPVWNSLSAETKQHQYMNFGPKGELEMKEHQQSGFAGVGANLPSNDQCSAWESAEFKYFDINSHNRRLKRVHHDM